MTLREKKLQLRTQREEAKKSVEDEIERLVKHLYQIREELNQIIDDANRLYPKIRKIDTWTIL